MQYLGQVCIRACAGPASMLGYFLIPGHFLFWRNCVVCVENVLLFCREEMMDALFWDADLI